MTRPKKCRRIQEMPTTTYFKPAGIPLRKLAEVILPVEETEALRLKDIDGLDQAASGAHMNISRPTFQRVLRSVRRKLADAVLNGKAIRIEGGNYELAKLSYLCRCGHRWQTAAATSTEPSIPACPVCESEDVATVPVGGGHRHGQGQA